MAIEKKIASEEYVNEKIAGIQTGNTDSVPASAIIDVVELPTENIREDCFYRLMTAKVMSGPVDGTDYGYIVRCVERLPEVGDPCTDAEQSHMVMYYNRSDGIAYGYIDDVLSAALSFPAGWYNAATLAEGMGVSYGGIITDISESLSVDILCILLCYDYYVYQHGEWTKLIFATEKFPKNDITWDGDMAGRAALDMSQLGYKAGMYFVKVSDDVYTPDEVIGGRMRRDRPDGIYDEGGIYSDSIDSTAYPGAFTINDYIVVVHSEEELATALGIPSGIYTNGVYFWTYVGDEYPEDKGHISRLTLPPRITKIDCKYVNIHEDNSGLHPVAFYGSWYYLDDKPDVYTDVVQYNTTQSLSSTQKSRARTNIDVYSKSEVQTLINTAIGTAIGGSY